MINHELIKRNLCCGISKFGLNRQEAAAYVGVSATKFDELVRTGTMPQPRLIGRRKVWIRTELEAALISLPVNDNERQNDWDAV